MISKTAFIDKVVETLEDFYGNDAEVSTKEVLKTNDVKNIGITIGFKDSGASCISPVIYIESYYQSYTEGKDFDLIIEDITRVAELHKMPVGVQNIVDDLRKWEFCKSKVYPILISTERNQEMLKNLVSKEVLDLSIIYIVRFTSKDDEMATVKISYDLMETWGVSSEKLHETALENMQGDGYTIQNMSSVLADVLDEDDIAQLESASGPRMMVLSCKSKMYAAAGVLDSGFMERATGGNPFYMIPSSVHEWIMIPVDDDANVEDLNAMIGEVNATQVSPTEILSDHAYKYCDGRLMCA